MMAQPSSVSLAGSGGGGAPAAMEATLPLPTRISSVPSAARRTPSAGELISGTSAPIAFWGGFWSHFQGLVSAITSGVGGMRVCGRSVKGEEAGMAAAEAAGASAASEFTTTRM